MTLAGFVVRTRVDYKLVPRCRSKKIEIIRARGGGGAHATEREGWSERERE